MIPKEFEITVERNCQVAVELRFAAHLALLWLEIHSSSLVKVDAWTRIRAR